MKRRKRKVDEAVVPEPPMTPMIDVIFQLLIYFMLTMNFKEIEGKLLSQLPKDKGLSPITKEVQLHEVRIFVCADGNIMQHRSNKGAHEKVAKSKNRCDAWVGGLEIGSLFLTEAHPDKGPHNRAVYRLIAEKVSELMQTPPAPVILDGDSEVPYEHIVGILNACKEKDLQGLEFVGNSKFESLYKD